MGCRRKNTLCLSLNFGANDGTLLPRLTRLETSPSPQKRLVLKFPIRELKDVRANCFCASLLRTQIHMPRHATSCIERARQVLKGTMIGQMAIAIALIGFNDLGRSVTPTFLFRNRFHLQLSSHC